MIRLKKLILNFFSYFKQMKNKKIYLLGFALIIFLFSWCLYFNSTNYILIKKLNNNEALILKYKNFIEGGEINKKIKFKNKIIQSVIDTAKSYIGTPNKIGGVSRDSIDASGLVYMSIKKNSDKKFPRIGQDMARFGKLIYKSEKLKKGDLVFFFDTYEVDRIITSTGIYLGENKFIHSSSLHGVTISEINDPYYWNDKFFFGTRVFKN
jgi:murein DD-endopeptidase / murein LD-carboxypeptidase